MNNKGFFGLLLITTLMCSGCATITRGTTEALVIETTPIGANVELSNGLHCKSPCSLEVKRKDPVTIDITKTGFEPARVNVLSEIAGAGAAGMAGNVILGGLIGVGVDAATGATKRLNPNPVKVTLNPIPPADTPSTAASATDAGSDVVLDKAQKRCTSVGYKDGSDDYRNCVMEQLKNLSGAHQ
jgi:hypothetical protein